MIIKMHPCLREQANLAFSRFTRKTADLTQIKDLFAAAVKNHRGIAISEACHGRYAYPLLMADMMLQAAHENGIRVVGVDNPEIRSGYGPAVDAPFKTMHWEGIISKDLRNLAPDQRYVVYGGESHLVDMGGALRGIHQYLEIPRVLMREGPYTIASHPLDKKPSFEVRIPQASRQDPISNRRDVRNNPVKWTV